ncbi:MFS transporter [Skermanella aerolata]|uniref:MFS transporter n=1 Tax=Skermanella aerolata TaxID=393310 RepID=A0A512DS88_9PROT|nr:MFS transporter [Skermanella aerolata]KJB94193.1 MFS transporter [Skermanella aerolata KACC 11604]GEO39296.1 MFS transporter [Skermanella aerolata]
MSFLSDRLARGRIHYGWYVAGITFVTLLVAAGIRSMPSILILPVEQEFGWSRATISFAVAINLVLYGLMGPFAAAFMERLGVRKTIVMSLVLVAGGVALTPLMTAPWQLVLLWGVVVGTGTGMTALVLGATVVNRWFSEQRGLVMGMLTASTATGQLLFLPLLAMIVEDLGWRTAVLGVACAALVIVPLVMLLMRERPRDVGLAPFGKTEMEAAPSRPTGNPFALAFGALIEGSRSRDFWLLFGTFFICGLSTNGLIGTHLIAACFDAGIPEVKAAGLLAMMGIFDLVGTTLSGWLSDRYNNRYLLAWYYGLRGLSLLWLPFALDLSFFGLSLFAVFYGLDWIATVPPTVRLATNSFGREKAPMMFGWIFTGHQLGAAVAAFGAGVLRTAMDGYLEAFLLAGLACFVAVAMSLMIGRQPTSPARVASEAA